MPNALEDPDWAENPDIELGMIAYLGYPLVWPDGKVFGTICVLDREKRAHSDLHQKLIAEFSEAINGHLGMLAAAASREALVRELAETRTNLEDTISQRTRELTGACEDLKTKNTDIESFNRSMLGREERMLELKREVNALRAELGRALLYDDEPASPPPALVEEGPDVETEPADLLDNPRLGGVLETFCAATGVATAIIDLKGNVLVAENWQRICTDFHRKNDHTCERCLQSDTFLANQLAEGQEYSIYTCRNGMTDAASPIIVNGQHIANAFIGQFHQHPPDQDMFRAQAREFGFDEEAYLAAVNEAPVIPADRLPLLLEFVTNMAKLVADVGLEKTASLRNQKRLESEQEHLKSQRRAALNLMEDMCRAEATRKEKEQHITLLSQMLDAAPSMVVIHDMEGHSLFANQAAVSVHGYDGIEEFLAVDLHDIDVPGSETSMTQRIRILSQEGQARFETAHYRKDGSVFPLEIHAKTIEWYGRPAILSIGTDITDRKRAETALRDSERRLHAIFEHHHQLTGLLDPEGRLLAANQTSLRFAGTQESEVIGRYFWDGPWWNPSQRSMLRNAIGRAAKGEYVQFETSHPTPEGEVRDIDFSLTPVRDDDGRVVYILPEGRDITEILRAQRALREREETFRALTENSVDTIMRFDRNLRHLYVNPAVEKLTGIPAADFIGKNHAEMGFPPDLVELWEEAIKRVFATGGVNRIEFMLPNGRWIDWILVPERHAKGEVKAVIASARDITERKRAEEDRQKLETQLRRAQKMEAVGQLAGGVAHDFNNILQAVMGYGEMALEETEAGTSLHEHVAEVMKAADRATTLVRQLLAFSRKQVLKLEVLDVNEVVEEFAKMIRRVIGEHIALEIRSDPGLKTVQADRGQLEQILMNLCVNARDSMPAGGRLTVETGNAELDADYCRENAWAKPGGYVLLSVSDTGCGMDEDTQQHIFEPFFTTKREGKGTGLGLATVYGIIRQHQGMIHVYSEVGSGTRFRIYLPASGAAVEPAQELEAPLPPGGAEMILLAEDDASVRNLARRVLETAGYTVLTTSDGEEAIRLFDLHSQEINLALLDVVMPKCGGRSVFQHIQNAGTQTAVLFASGYSAGAIDTGFLLEEGMQLIQKPYQRDDLLRKVRQVLDA